MTGPIPQRARGRRALSLNPLIPTWSSLRPKGLMRAVQIPSTEDWLQGMPALLGGLHNAYDQDDPNGLIVGNCTIAAVLHILQVMLFRTTGRFWAQQELSPLALSLYVAWDGYVIGDPTTDRGGIIENVLTKWMTEGLTLPDGKVHKILGFVRINPKDEAELREAIAICGTVDFGAAIPASYDQINPGDSWLANQGDPDSGHCFFSAKYLDSIIMDSWGFQVPMPPDAVAQYVDEAFAIISPDWVQKTGLSPGGNSIAQIEAIMQPLRMAA